MMSDWVPLEKMLGPRLCERFMYMGGPERSISTNTSIRDDT